MTVYVIQNIEGRDFSSAQRYGRIEYIWPNSMQPSMTPGLAIERATICLERFRPKEDHVLFAGGDPLGPLIIGVVFQKLFPGQGITMLRWERERDITGNRIPGAGFYTPSLLILQ